MYFDQKEFDLRLEWGPEGVRQVAPGSDAVVIVDVLSFTTCVDIAAGRGAAIYPVSPASTDLEAYAQAREAILAGRRGQGQGHYSLSPASLVNIEPGTRLVLPSPNGAALSVSTGQVATLAGCLRNARAVADAARLMGRQITIVPAGERWAGGALRPAIEDLLGAGAIIHYLPGSRSPEAMVAEIAFEHLRNSLEAALLKCSSGKELVERGFTRDVELAAELDVSESAPMLRGEFYK